MVKHNAIYRSIMSDSAGSNPNDKAGGTSAMIFAYRIGNFPKGSPELRIAALYVYHIKLR
jgi:hypothetical protein